MNSTEFTNYSSYEEFIEEFELHHGFPPSGEEKKYRPPYKVTEDR